MSISNEQLKKELLENGKTLEKLHKEYGVSLGYLSQKKDELNIKSIKTVSNMGGQRALWLEKDMLDKLPIEDPDDVYWDYELNDKNQMVVDFNDVRWRKTEENDVSTS